MSKKLIVNPKLKKCIQALTKEEYQNLEERIRTEGCRDALVIWHDKENEPVKRYCNNCSKEVSFILSDGFYQCTECQTNFAEIEYTIIDGHNRFEICQKNGIEFKLEEHKFENIVHAKKWMILNQFSRRNLNPFQRSVLALELEAIYKELAKSNLKLSKGHGIKGSETSPTVRIDTREEIAKVGAVSSNTISRVKIILNEAGNKIKEKLNSGEMSINQAFKEIKADDKSIKLKEKKAEYVEKFKAEMIIVPEVNLMDCKDFLNTFPDDSIDLLYTDPPYSTDVPDINAFTESWLPLAIQKTKKSGRMLIFSGAYPEEMEVFLKILRSQYKFIVDNPLVWIYNNTLGVTPKMKYNLNYQLIWHLYSNESPELDTSITKDMFSAQVENAPDGRQGNRLHQWQKSDDLAIKHITQTTEKGDLVVDPFTCTGTFLIAAGKLERIGKGCDNKQTNLNIAISRGCKLINNSDDAPSTDNNVTIYADQFQDELPSNEPNKTCNSDEYLDVVALDDLLKIAKDVEEVDKNLSTDQITENTALEAQPSNVGFKKPLEKNRNVHKVNRREIKKMFQAKN